jgi:hypothetical protein
MGESGEHTFVPPDLERQLADSGRPPTQVDLDAVVAPATFVVVRNVGSDDVLYETQDPAELASLRDALRVVEEEEDSRCMCVGTISFLFHRDSEQLGTVTLHHGQSLRWDPFFFDATLAESDPILDWLSQRGLPGERETFDEDRRNRDASLAELDRWHALVPPALEPLWHAMSTEPGLEWPEAEALMDRAYPDPVARARVLFEWFGQGNRLWSGQPAYELVPAWCLLELPLDVLVEAAQAEPQTESLLEGVMRLFGGWDFRKRRRRDLQRIPAELKQTLLELALASPDEGKRTHAQRAFGSTDLDG